MIISITASSVVTHGSILLINDISTSPNKLVIVTMSLYYHYGPSQVNAASESFLAPTLIVTAEGVDIKVFILEKLGGTLITRHQFM